MDMNSQPQSSQSRQLTSDDLQEVFEALYSVSFKYINLGLGLNVAYNRIRTIAIQYADPNDCLREILDHRLSQLPPLTWHEIVRALQSQSIHQHDLARRIESRYITVSQSPASVSLQPSMHEVHSDPPQAKRPRHDTSVAQLSQLLPSQGSVTSQHDALYPPEFTSFVKRVYRRSKVGNPKDTKWPPMASKHFINLVIINRETVSLDEADEYTKSLVLHGDLDAILHEKQPIELNTIAKDVPEDSIILVEGAPGVGKSTFAWEFCRRWERGEIAQQYQLVLLLRLRDYGMSYAKNLEDLIRLYHHSDTLCQAVLRTLKASRGESSLIILEGFDELPTTCRTESSVFLKLISGKVLEKATVLITSRHWATRIIQQTNEDRIFQHIEILGFTEPQIKEYIRSIFIDKRKDPDQIVNQKINKTMAYVEKYPQIKACMYIPLNTAIVVNVYQESKANRCILPRTLTELYLALTQTLLLRYLYGHPEYGQEDWVVRDIKRDIPEEVFTKLLNICHEAYKGICSVDEGSVQLIFSNLHPGFETLGFMQSVPQLYTTQGAVVSHNFLHLTVQEFLTALHISFMSPEQQLEHLKRHKEGTLKVVLRFLAGLTKLANISLEQIKGLFSKPLQKNESSQEKCCTRMTPDISVDVHHTNWMFETQSTEIIKTLLENGIVEFICEKGMVPLEYYCVGYCIAHSQCNWCLTFAEHMEDEKLEMFLTEINKTGGGAEHRVAVKTDQPMSSEKLNILFAALGPWLEELYLKLADNGSFLSLTNLSALHILELGMCSKSTFNISSTFPLQSLESLTINAGNGGNTLGLKSCEAIGKLLLTSTSLKELHFNATYRKTWSMSTKCIEAITKGMRNNMALPLRSLEIECKCTFSNTAANFLSVYIGRSTILQTFSLRSITISATCIEAITKGMRNNMALPLRSLEIECKCTFSNTAAKSVAQFIRNSTALKYIRMCNVEISSCGLIEMTEALLHCSSLQEKKLEKLLLRSIANDDEVTKLIQMFHDHPDMLQCIDWETNLNNEFQMSRDDEKVQVFAIAIHHNVIEIEAALDLSKNSISDIGAIALAQALHHNSTLKELNLSHNNLSDAGATALAQALHHNSTLKELNLSHNNISDAGAIALAQALHHNSTLKELNLSHNNLSDAGATALAQALHHNSTLKELNLSHNNLSDAGATALAQALHHNSTLKELNLSHNNLSDAGATALAQALHHNSTLKELNLSHNNISESDAGATDLAQALHHNSTLERLLLHGNNGIGEEGTRQLVQALTVNTSTNNYVIDNNDDMAGPLRNQEIECKFKFSNIITADILSIRMSTSLQYSSERSITINTTYMEIITECLSDNMAPPLRSLRIECEGLCSNTVAKSLSLLIRNSTALKYIRMCNVEISSCGLIEITEALLHCSSLQEKKLEKLLLHSIASDDEVPKLNQMFHDHPDMLHCIDWETNLNNEFRMSHDDEKVRVFAIASHNLIEMEKTLDLHNNSISDAGATALAQSLHHNSTLKELCVHHNNISDTGATELAQALHHNSTLKKLDLSYNNISDAGATDLAQALHRNSTLEMLDLSHNNISDAGAKDLAQALHHNSTLKKLFVHHNNISDAGATDLAQALYHNSTLETLTCLKPTLVMLEQLT